MSHTRNGKLIGAARHTELMDEREYVRSVENTRIYDPWLKQYYDTCNTLSGLMGKDEFEKWFWACPEQTREEMYPVMLAKIDNLLIETQRNQQPAADGSVTGYAQAAEVGYGSAGPM